MMKYYFKRLWHELNTPTDFKKKERGRGFIASVDGWFPEEDATYWYMDGYHQGRGL